MTTTLQNMAAKRHQPVQAGGLFTSHKVTVSKETQDLLKVMMNEARLTNFQQRTLNTKIKRGEPLPLHCSPTTSKPLADSKTARSTKKKSKSTDVNGRGLRSMETIEKMQKIVDKNYLPPQCHQHRGYNSSIEKEKLQTVMANEELTVANPSSPIRVRRDDEEMERTSDEILQEIEERQVFLEEMERLGRGKEFKNKIITEISQKLRELELLKKT